MKQKNNQYLRGFGDEILTNYSDSFLYNLLVLFFIKWYHNIMFDLPLGFVLLILFVFGCCIGSFLCVCAERLPQGKSIVYPGSHCPFCQKKIPWFLNIPVISWLYLKGKSACCQKKIPFRYFLSEVLTGIGAIVFYVHSKELFFPYFALFCFLWVAFLTDLSEMIIPDEISLLGICVGVLMSFFYPQMHACYENFEGMVTSLKSICLGMGGLFLFISFLEFFLKKEAMGFGDIKLIGCIGAFLGWEGCLFSLFFGSIIGSVVMLLFFVFQKAINKKTIQLRNKQIPFGPFLSFAAIFYILSRVSLIK